MNILPRWALFFPPFCSDLLYISPSLPLISRPSFFLFILFLSHLPLGALALVDSVMVTFKRQFLKVFPVFYIFRPSEGLIPSSLSQARTSSGLEFLRTIHHLVSTSCVPLGVLALFGTVTVGLARKLRLASGYS